MPHDSSHVDLIAHVLLWLDFTFARLGVARSDIAHLGMALGLGLSRQLFSIDMNHITSFSLGWPLPGIATPVPVLDYVGVIVSCSLLAGQLN